MSQRCQLMLALFTLIPAMALAEDSASRDWPTFRGPLATGEARPGQAANWPSPATLEPRWKTSVGSGYSGVSVAGKVVVTGFAADGQDWLGAFDLDSGAALWKVAFEPTYIGHDGSHDGPIATPAISEGTVLGLSARGILVAVDVATGKERWRRNLGAEEGAQKPHYGHGSSPIVTGGLVIVAMPVEGKQSIVAVRLGDGSTAWSVGSDTINYQSPILAEIGGKTQVLALSDVRLWGLDAATGAELWSFEHGGDFGAAWAVPLPVGRNRVFLTAKQNEGQLLEVTRGADGAWAVASVWQSNVLGRSYAPPAYHDGVIYGYSGNYLSAMDAATGERLWRSRPPGDGFIAIADDRLVVLTKKGELHVAATSREGWKPIGATQLYDAAAWTPPSIAEGKIVTRSIGGLAVVDVRPGASAAVGLPTLPADSAFGAFLAKLAAMPAGDRAAAIDAYLTANASEGPIVEGDRMIFLYRGEGRDLGITGSMIGQRMELPMVQVEGTDLFWWATTLVPGARVEYQFVKDYEERVNDPRNPRVAPSARPNPPSWATMPGWKAPAWLGAAAAQSAGKVVRHELEVAAVEAPAEAPAAAAGEEPSAPAKRLVEVWLPPGYDEGEARYPVSYVHWGDEAVTVGKLPAALDHLVAAGAVEPQIVVFLHRVDQQTLREFVGDLGPAYLEAVASEIVPLIDSTYRTRPNRDSRASVGFGFSAAPALAVALDHRELFGRVVLQSAFMLTDAEKSLWDRLPAGETTEPKVAVELEWGTYDLRAEHEGWDARAVGRRLVEALEKAGHPVTTREVPDGHGWGSWAMRVDQVFGGLFGG